MLPGSSSQLDMENQSKPVTVSWLIRRLGKVAAFEATNAPRESVKVMDTMQCNVYENFTPDRKSVV